MRATSGTFSPVSKSLEMASWRRSWKWRPLITARRQDPVPGLTGSAFTDVKDSIAAGDGAAPQNAEGAGTQGRPAAIAVLGHGQEGDGGAEIDVLPAQRQKFPAAH
jgi:hypothetical protein